MWRHINEKNGKLSPTSIEYSTIHLNVICFVVKFIVIRVTVNKLDREEAHMHTHKNHLMKNSEHDNVNENELRILFNTLQWRICKRYTHRSLITLELI